MDEACVLCGEVITNPICIECLEKEMEYWLMDKNMEMLAKEVTDISKSYTHDVTDCIICRKNMNICAHCYAKEVSSLIRSRKIKQEFMWQFNYELVF